MKKPSENDKYSRMKGQNMKDSDNNEEAKVVGSLVRGPSWNPEYSKSLKKPSLAEVEFILQMEPLANNVESPVNNKEEAELTPETETQVSEIQEAPNIIKGNAIALSRQGWTNNEIAKALRISRDEVDSILEKNRKG